ncbi:hypothetical protein EVJ58_g5442 [Rhodofomes roseus]|uniref:Uncharacterized protein n=1 Tax=Rhodofomes roseus TaxID=34475 RepID=A0A4Y9YEI5_9APHY|nr:hypothetical protein EVJ58_g5442 [Rhodofomes roseus]
MPEYVYALHEFAPENPDEVPLKLGDKIEVIEKDDLYGDGWWKGRNPAGAVGLFPQTYTSPNPSSVSSRLAVTGTANASPASSTVEVPAASTSKAGGTSQPPHGTADPILSHSTEELATGSNGAQRSGSAEVMQATMTDVQKAIEQLGRGNDESRSFSFMSSRSQSTDHSDAEDEREKDEDEDETGYGWSKGARTMLAMRAQMENERREAQSRTDSTAGSGTPVRLSGPPHDFEVSDESEDEGEEHIHLRHLSDRVRSSDANGRISEEDEEDDEPTSKPTFTITHSRTSTMDFRTPPPPITISDSSLRNKKSRDSSALIVPSEDFIVPSPSAATTEITTARPEQSTFPQEQLSPDPAKEEPAPSPSMNIIEASPIEETPSPSRQTSAPPEEEKPAATSTTPEPVPAPTALHPTSTPNTPLVVATSPSVQTVSPSPSTVRIAETPQLSFPSSNLPSPTASSFGGATSSSSAGVRQTLTPATTVSMMSAGGPEVKVVGSGSSGSSTRKERPDGHPSEWAVEQVVEWLRAKGFDEGVCEKFIEQEITGDVLLELDANVLKTEIGIVAFGKRARIVNAITELRRPPSIFEPVSAVHTLAFREPAKLRAYAGVFGVGVLAVVRAGLSAQPDYCFAGCGAPAAHRRRSTRDEWPAAQVDGNGVAKVEGGEPGTQAVGLGLGLAQAIKDGKRPAQLILSPSDGAIAATAVGGDVRLSGEEDRGAMSESETVASDTKTKSRRLFWRTDNGSIREKSSLNDTASRHSKDTSIPQTPPLSAATVASVAASSTNSPDDTKSVAEGAPPVPTARPKKKRESVDGRKASDRLSLFGTSFSGTLGKGGRSRKPPPSLSGAIEKSEDEKEKHHGTFARIREKRSSSRPSTADGAKDKRSGQFPSLNKVKESPNKDSEKPKEPKETSKEPKHKAKEAKDQAKEPERSAVLRKRTASTVGVPVEKTPKADDTPRSPTSPDSSPLNLTLKPGQSILEQIGTPDHEGWLRKKGERYNAWKVRYFVLKGPHLYWLRNKSKTESKIKGYINIAGYKVVADENIDPGRYGFRIMHDSEKTHYFSSEEHVTVREWMKALMKATITRDYADLVVSSCNIPTIPLAVAQAMNPAPRPPSPGARAATQKAMRPENPNQLTQRDAQVLLMGVTAKEKGSSERTRLDSFFTNDTRSTTSAEPSSPRIAASKVPPRPSREMRRLNSLTESTTSSVDAGLIDWANSHLPKNLQVADPSSQIYGGLALLRLAEDIKGKQATPRVPDSAFPSGPNDDKLDGLFKLFDFLLDNDVKMGTVSINDIRQGKRDKMIQLLKALRAWEDRRKAIAQSLGPPSPPPGSYMAMAGPMGMGPG